MQNLQIDIGGHSSDFRQRDWRTRHALWRGLQRRPSIGSKDVPEFVEKEGFNREDCY